MIVKSSLCFVGVFFLLKASFALSAPHSSYPDEDEEALIDKLASFAAAVGAGENVGPVGILPKSESQSQAQYLNPPNYDLYLSPDAGEWSNNNGGESVDGLLNRAALLDLPRQFGYKPNDIRFYLSADQFPPQEEEPRRPAPQQAPELQENHLPMGNPAPVSPQIVRNSVASGNVAATQQQKGQHEQVPGDSDKSDFYFMKKKEQQTVDRNYVPGPSHIMASEHSVNGPGYTSRQVEMEKKFTYSDMYYIAIVAGVSAAAVVGLMAAGICYYRIHERIKAAADVDYPAYGVTGPSKDITPSGGGDRKLAQSAQMYHYQHQKQQMAALQKGAIQSDRQGSGGSDVESEDDNEDGDYTVYECPGLAPAGEMEVKNPLFQEEQATPATPNTLIGKKGEQEASNSHDSCSSAADSASSSASSTATVTSSTPKITESPNTPPPTAEPVAPAPEPPKKPEKRGKGKSEKK